MVSSATPPTGIAARGQRLVDQLGVVADDLHRRIAAHSLGQRAEVLLRELGRRAEVAVAERHVGRRGARAWRSRCRRILARSSRWPSRSTWIAMRPAARATAGQLGDLPGGRRPAPAVGRDRRARPPGCPAPAPAAGAVDGDASCAPSRSMSAWNSSSSNSSAQRLAVPRRRRPARRGRSGSSTSRRSATSWRDSSSLARSAGSLELLPQLALELVRRGRARRRASRTGRAAWRR